MKKEKLKLLRMAVYVQSLSNGTNFQIILVWLKILF